VLEKRAEQEEWKDGLRSRFRSGVRFVLGYAPVGFGKTTGFAEIAESITLQGGRTAVFVHRDIIGDQISERLLERGIIHGFQMGGRPEYPEAPVQIVTPQSYLGRAARYGSLSEYDFVIKDECHRAVSKTYLECDVDLERRSPDHHDLGTSATPTRLDNKPLKLRYTEIVLAPQPNALCDLGRLVRPLVFSPPCVVDLNGVPKSMGDLQREAQARILNSKVFHAEVVGSYEKYAPETQALVFASTIEHAYILKQEIKAAGYGAEVLEGKTSPAQRAEFIRQFRAKDLRFLVSVELLTEGFDVPGAETVIFARKTMSTQLYLQAIGRVMRSAPGKTKAYVLDLVGNVYRHGSPCADRTWSLEGVVVERHHRAIRQCMHCYAWIDNIGLKDCTECGASLASTKVRTFRYQPNGALAEIEDVKPKEPTKKDLFDAELKAIHWTDPQGREKCGKLAEKYGYKKAFGYMRWKFKRVAGQKAQARYA